MHRHRASAQREGWEPEAAEAVKEGGGEEWRGGEGREKESERESARARV
jgi:hypothetical protein